MDKTKLDKLPTHVAIIMDGNGRWAKQKKLKRVEGHRIGMESVREIVTATCELKIPYLTLYAFSKENWARPKDAAPKASDCFVPNSCFSGIPTDSQA